MISRFATPPPTANLRKETKKAPSLRGLPTESGGGVVQRCKNSFRHLRCHLPQEGGFRFHSCSETKSLLRREKVDFAKQKTDEVLYASETTHPTSLRSATFPHKGRLLISLRLDIKGSLV